MRQFLQNRRVWAAVFVATIAMMGTLSGVVRWSPLNCWHQEVDINSGRIRHVRMLAFLNIRTRIEETWLSRALDTTADRPDWRRVNTFSPGISYSPHYQFHDAINQIQLLEIVDKQAGFTEAERQEIAAALFPKWQSGDDAEAERFVRTVSEQEFGRR